MPHRNIRIFKSGNIKRTPFNEHHTLYNELLKHDIIYVEDYDACDICVIKTMKELMLTIDKYGNKKKYLLWNSEPCQDKNFVSKIRANDATVHIMNTYTGDIWINNFCVYSPKQWTNSEQLLKLNSQVDFSRPKGKKIVALVTYRNNEKKWSNIRNGVEIGLSYRRTQIALEGHHLGKVDVYGKGWPDGISLEDSRMNIDWRGRKEIILKDYYFNLALENTSTDYYCTEKIWDSIRAGCLPIYYGKDNKIYENFPRHSFIDYSNFNSPSKLFSYIDNMGFQEFKERFNSCLKVCLKAAKNEQLKPNIRAKRVENLTEKLHFIMNDKPF